MESSKPTFRSRVYRDFRGIDPMAHHSVIRFFERREQEIRRLDWDEFFPMLVAYTHALFRTGAYRQFLVVANELLEASMVNDSTLLAGEDIFLRTLYEKGYAHVRLLELPQARHVLQELLRIDPHHQEAARLYRTALYRELPSYIQITRALSILLFLVAALIIGVEVLMIRPFYSRQTFLFEATRMGIFLLGLLFLGIGNMVHFVHCSLKTQRLLRQIKARQAQKGKIDQPI